MNIDEIMNIKEVSGYLKIPISTIYKLAQSGKVPAVKVGKHWRFMKKDLENLFEKKEENQLEIWWVRSKFNGHEIKYVAEDPQTFLY